MSLNTWVSIEKDSFLDKVHRYVKGQVEKDETKIISFNQVWASVAVPFFKNAKLNDGQKYGKMDLLRRTLEKWLGPRFKYDIVDRKTAKKNKLEEERRKYEDYKDSKNGT